MEAPDQAPAQGSQSSSPSKTVSHPAPRPSSTGTMHLPKSNQKQEVVGVPLPTVKSQKEAAKKNIPPLVAKAYQMSERMKDRDIAHLAGMALRDIGVVDPVKMAGDNIMNLVPPVQKVLTDKADQVQLAASAMLQSYRLLDERDLAKGIVRIAAVMGLPYMYNRKPIG